MINWKKNVCVEVKKLTTVFSSPTLDDRYSSNLGIYRMPISHLWPEINWSQTLPFKSLHLFEIQFTNWRKGVDDHYFYYLEKEMATHSSILAWKIPWTEEPGRLQSMGSQRGSHDWATLLLLYFYYWIGVRWALSQTVGSKVIVSERYWMDEPVWNARVPHTVQGPGQRFNLC